MIFVGKDLNMEKENNLKVNRKYKDKIFCKLFGREEHKENLLSLYNALNKTNYTNVDDLEITTLEDVLYMNYKNDVSIICEADNMLSLYEHQSTFNPNMPLRGVGYFAKLYSKYIGDEWYRIYGTSIYKIPTPKYFVFYNGLEDTDDVTTLRLSEMYEGEGDLECIATMININQGHSQELLEKCGTLMEYSKFVWKTYQNIEKYDSMSVAIDTTLEECLQEGILVEFLKKHKSEVKGMLYDEYDQEKHLKSIEKWAREEGREEGREEAVLDMLAKGTITIEQAAEELGITSEDIKEKISL